MPAWLASLKPGLVPARRLVAKVFDLGIAPLATSMADLPFIRPVLSVTAYLGPEGEPVTAIYARDGIYIVIAIQDIILIASAFRWLWKYCFAAMGGIIARPSREF
jgi:hypothetical protein